MRAALRRPAAALALSGPVARLTRRALEGRTKIVYAHHVEPPAHHHAAFGPALTPEQLDDHLTTLGRHFEFASLPAVLEHNTDGNGSSQMLAVTFDDGFDLVRSGALEVLNAHGVRATTFVLTAMLDNRGLMWRNKLSAIQTLRPEEAYVSANNRLMASVGCPGIRDATEFLSAAMRWDMGRKEELATRSGRRVTCPHWATTSTSTALTSPGRPSRGGSPTVTPSACIPTRTRTAPSSTTMGCEPRSSSRLSG